MPSNLQKKAQKKLVEKLPVILPKLAKAGAVAVTLPGGTALPAALRKIPNAGPMLALVAAPNLAGKRVAITGAARGLGAGLAQLLPKEGARVALLGIEPDELEAVTAGIKAKRGDWAAACFACDVTDQASVDAALKAAADWMGGLDHVVANAGVGFFGTGESMPEATLEKTYDVNFFGAVRTARAAIPYLRESKGHLTLISSASSGVSSPAHGAYASSKAALASYAASLRLELQPDGITVGTVHPTFAKTDMMLKDTLQDEVGTLVWAGNKGGLWGMVEPKVVVQAIRDGMATRARRTVVPRRLFPVILAPGVFQPFVELSFKPRLAAINAAAAKK